MVLLDCYPQLTGWSVEEQGFLAGCLQASWLPARPPRLAARVSGEPAKAGDGGDRLIPFLLVRYNELVLAQGLFRRSELARPVGAERRRAAHNELPMIARVATTPPTARGPSWFIVT